MANMHDCIQRAVDAGELDVQRAAAAGRQYDQLVDRYGTTMPRHAAEAAAAKDLREATRKAKRARFHKTVNQLQAMRRIKGLIETAPDPAVAIRNLMEFSEGSGFQGESVASVERSLVRLVNARMREVLAKHSRNIVGQVRGRAQFENIVRELHGDATGDAAAAQLAEAVRSTQGMLRRMFNAQGGDIGKLSDYGLPHAHDVAALRRVTPDQWADEIMPRLVWDRIVDNQTGQPFAAGSSEARKRAFLREVYQGIVTRGWDTREPGLSVGGRALYNQRAEHRVLHFQSGQDWLAYNRAFGHSDPFSAMMGGLHGMARDVAMMRVLGPSPRAGLEYAEQVAAKRVAGNAKAETAVRSQGALAKAMLAHTDGTANTPVNVAWASFFGSTRQVLTAIQLGSAAMSAVTDYATISMASSVMGMNPGNVLARQMQLMASGATRETAARMGYVADTLANAGSAAARFTGETFVPEAAQRLSDFTMRASLLSQWTDINRTAFQMEFAGFLAENAGRDFAAIDAPLRHLFQTRGITPADWDALRNAPLFEAPNGAQFLSPFHWLEAQTGMTRTEAEGLAVRLQMAIEEQLEYAVPSANLEGRARLQGEARPGTFAGELLRSSMMYKSFAVSLTVGQVRRFMAIPVPINRWAYAAKMSVGLFALGAVAVQLKELAKGRDPRPMNEMKFGMAALFQGGGLGIFGDFFSSETNRAGGGIAETLAGPVAGFASSVIRPFASNVQRVAEGKEPLIGRDAANFVRYNTPVLSSLWYERLAFDRMVADQLQLMLDPEAETLFRRQEARRARDYGNATWWDRGRMAPSRAPDLSNALGDAR